MLRVFDKNLNPVGVLPDADQVQRKRRLNSDYELSFLVPMNSDDYTQKITLKGHVRDDKGQYYVINSRKRDRGGLKRMALISCMHIMFKLTDFKMPYDSYIEEGYGVNIVALTDSISAATGGKFIFVIDDVFDLKDVKDFGRGNALQALNYVIKTYGAEVEPNNFAIHLKKKIGVDAGLQYRFKKNIISDTYEDDARALVTRMFSQMKDGLSFIGLLASHLTTEEYNLLNAIPGAIVGGEIKVNYLISPYWSYWSNSTNTYYDGEIIDQNIEDPLELLETTRKALREQEVPAIDVTVSAADLHKIDGTEPRPSLGDTAYLIDPDMELNNMTARVVELTEYPFAMDKHYDVNLANFMKRDYDDIISDLDRAKQIVEDITSGAKVRTTVFEAFAKQAIYDINNSKTEVKYDQRGIVLQDKANVQNQVVLSSNGVYLTTDGGVTPRAAITANGVVAEVIVGILGQFAQVKTDNLIAGTALIKSALIESLKIEKLDASTAKITSAMIDTIKANQIDVSTGRIVAAQIDATNLQADSVKSTWVYTGSLNASQITAGQIAAQYINTAGLAAEKIYQAGYPNNYTVLGGSYGDMVMYYDGIEFFRLYYALTNLQLRYKGLPMLQMGDSGTVTPLSTWNFGSATVTGIPISGVTDLQSSLDGKSPTNHNHGNIYTKSANLSDISFQIYNGNLEVFENGLLVGTATLT